jgi:hypothetical protein
MWLLSLELAKRHRTLQKRLVRVVKEAIQAKKAGRLVLPAQDDNASSSVHDQSLLLKGGWF